MKNTTTTKYDAHKFNSIPSPPNAAECMSDLTAAITSLEEQMEKLRERLSYIAQDTNGKTPEPILRENPGVLNWRAHSSMRPSACAQ